MNEHKKPPEMILGLAPSGNDVQAARIRYDQETKQLSWHEVRNPFTHKAGAMKIANGTGGHNCEGAVEIDITLTPLDSNGDTIDGECPTEATTECYGLWITTPPGVAKIQIDAVLTSDSTVTATTTIDVHQPSSTIQVGSGSVTATWETTVYAYGGAAVTVEVTDDSSPDVYTGTFAAGQSTTSLGKACRSTPMIVSDTSSYDYFVIDGTTIYISDPSRATVTFVRAPTWTSTTPQMMTVPFAVDPTTSGSITFQLANSSDQVTYHQAQSRTYATLSSTNMSAALSIDDALPLMVKWTDGEDPKIIVKKTGCDET